MKSWKAIVGITTVFLLGVLAGGLLTAGIIRHRFRHQGDVIVQRLSWKLGLDETQRDELRVIVTDAEEQVRVLRQQVQPQMETVLTQAEAKVRLILTPDQIEKFNKIVAERHTKWKAEGIPSP